MDHAALLALTLPAGPAAIWFWITLAIALVWLRRHMQLNYAHTDPTLAAQPAPPADAALPRLSVLVAAKDEEANIERCAATLLAQRYPDFELIVINDRSADRTPEIIDALARRDPRFRAVHIRECPPDWFGKNHAMHIGAQTARGEWLAFSDADCEFDDANMLARAVTFARHESADFLSVLPELEAHTFWERVIQPVAGAVMVIWFNPKRVNSREKKTAYANGAFMLLPRRIYDLMGGHEHVKAAMNEDMHLARRVKALGLKLRVIRGGGVYRVRMYTGLTAIWRGWTRIFYGCMRTFWRLLGSVGMLSIFSLSPYVTLIAALIALFAGSPTAGAFALAAAITILAQQSVLWRFYRLSGSSAKWALTYPLGAAMCLGITLNAMTRLAGAKTTWRGASYRGGA